MARKIARRDEWMRDGEKDGVRASSLESDRGGGGRTAKNPWTNGNDAASMKPRLIPDYELLPRDDSGGPEWDPYTQEFGDGGYVTGDKAHLSVSGGKDDEMKNDEISSRPRAVQADADEPRAPTNFRDKIPARSRKLAKE